MTHELMLSMLTCAYRSSLCVTRTLALIISSGDECSKVPPVPSGTVSRPRRSPRARHGPQSESPCPDPHPSNLKPDILVNCSGLGSRNLAGVHDMQMFPTRGQIVVVKVPDEIWPKAKRFTMERYAEGSAMGTGTITYVIPRDNGEIVLGGTMQHWN